MKTVDINALAQSIDSTFGRSSTPQTASYSVKITQAGPDILSVSYAAIVNFGNEREMIHMKRAYVEEAASVISAYLKRVKENYKEITGDTIKLTLRDPVDSVEIINYNCHNCKRTAYIRRKCLAEIN